MRTWHFDGDKFSLTETWPSELTPFKQLLCFLKAWALCNELSTGFSVGAVGWCDGAG